MSKLVNGFRLCAFHTDPFLAVVDYHQTPSSFYIHVTHLLLSSHVIDKLMTIGEGATSLTSGRQRAAIEDDQSTRHPLATIAPNHQLT